MQEEVPLPRTQWIPAGSAAPTRRSTVHRREWRSGGRRESPAAGAWGTARRGGRRHRELHGRGVRVVAATP